MFSRFYSSTRTFFSRSPSFTQNPEQQDTPAGQAQAELQDAAADAEAMVTTRRQEHESQGSTLVEGLETNSPRVSAKRKAAGPKDDTPRKNGKRARTRSSLNGSQEPASGQEQRGGEESTLVRTPAKDAAQDASQISISPEEQVEDKASTHVPSGATDTDQNGAQILPLRPHDETTSEQDAADIQVPDSLPRPPIQDSIEEVGSQLYPTLEAQDQDPPESVAKELNDSTPAPSQSAAGSKAKHKRFGSEDEMIPDTQPARNSVQYPDLNSALDSSKTGAGLDDDQGEGEDEDEDSEDEAPEAVSASTGQAQARNAAAEAERAARKQMEAVREKRRQRDAELKEQSQAAKKEKEKKEKRRKKKEAKHQGSEEPEETLAQKLLRSDQLPNELPAEILAAHSNTRATTTPLLELLESKPKAQNKRKLLDVDSKPPKDVRRNGKIFRTLQSTSSVLPPKVSKSSKSVREAWLRGRKGVAEKRTPASRGFVHKQ